MANTCAIQQRAAHTTYHHLRAAQQEQKDLPLNEKHWRIIWGKSQEIGPLVHQQKNEEGQLDQVERRTREEMGKRE